MLARLSRRRWLGGAVGALALPAHAAVDGLGEAIASAAAQARFVGEAQALGHRLRGNGAQEGQASGPLRRVALLVVGAGVAGLSAAMAARAVGIDDLAVIDLHEQAGGNSRGHAVALPGGAMQPCPLGAHYLPVPVAAAGNRPLWEWLHRIGLMRHESGRSRPDERHLCHAPQERLWFEGAWHEGLMPPLEPGSARQRQAIQLARWVNEARRSAPFSLPAERSNLAALHRELDAQSFATALAARGIDDPALRQWLDYCCLDEYGAPAREVSAWAGVHYFASRHGLHVPGLEAAAAQGDAEREQVFTWPEGNHWLVQRLAAGLGERLLTGRMALRVGPGPGGVDIDVLTAASGQVGRWHARQVVLALPLHVARRIVLPSLPALVAASTAAPQAAWLVANLLLDRAPLARPGVPLAWDNVRHGSSGHLGYVNTGHQALVQPAEASPVVFTAYRAWPWRERAALLDANPASLARETLAELALLHPDLPRRVQRIELTRHGHAMSIPVPGLRQHAALRALALGEAATPRLHWAHGDLAGYSVFEEAFAAGVRAGQAAARALHRG
jgi:monoamine oxidase